MKSIRPLPMEQTGVLSEEAWSSLSGMYTTNEEAEFMAQLFNGFICPTSVPIMSIPPPTLWSKQEISCITRNMAPCFVDDSLVYTSDPSDTTECFFSQETCTYSCHDDVESVLFPKGTFYPGSDSHQMFKENDVSESTKPMASCDWGTSGITSPTGVSADNLMELDECFSQSTGDRVVHRQGDMPLSKSGHYGRQRLGKQVVDHPSQDNCSKLADNKKRPRNEGDVPKNKRNAKSNKCQKVVSDDSSDGAITRQSSGSQEEEEEESNGSPELSGGEPSKSKRSKGSGAPSGRAKAGRGSATDPQSLYARKRRERINERLKTLQILVPNGTKVDISTMLEEAVQYVKFLQLQIKLLSSDETWMYAPLAYNGMDIGLNLNITSPR